MRTKFFAQHRTLSAVKRIEFVGDTVSYTVLRDDWCNIVVLKVHTPRKETSDDSKDSYCEELGRCLIIFISAI